MNSEKIKDGLNRLSVEIPLIRYLCTKDNIDPDEPRESWADYYHTARQIIKDNQVPSNLEKWDGGLLPYKHKWSFAD